MKNTINILVAGGDARQLYCAAGLAAEPGFSVEICGADDIPEELGLKRAELSGDKLYDCVVLPVIPIDNDGNIYAPLSSVPLKAEKIRSSLKSGAVIFAGRTGTVLQNAFPEMRTEGYIDREELSLKNAVPTAEGAVMTALGSLPVTLNGLSVLIAGMGRIGTALAPILKGFGAETAAAVRNERGAAKARIAGIRPIRTASLAGADNSGYSVVFNTVPSLVFGYEELKGFRQDCLFIELASEPGGIDTEAAECLGLRVISAPGLPGKTAPVTAGHIIAETIAEVINEEVS
ncbi:MAG: dipicolinate synthase subunit A [Ruminococcus sp.]|nr:dipicolinate synthase subunit A [Ruminococcus sp.]